MSEKNPLQQLWELRQYLRRMRDLQTVLVKFDGLSEPEYIAFGFTEGYPLGSEFKEFSQPSVTVRAMLACGLDPMKRGTVYAYIERRSPAFVPEFYGWGIAR